MSMIRIKTQPYIYDTLKNSFREGMEFNRVPFQVYYERRIGDIVPDKEASENINIYKGTTFLELIRKKAYLLIPDLGKVKAMADETSYQDKLIYEGRFKLENTFFQGSSNPDICLMAWYDALAEHVLEVANSFIGEKTPVPVIQDELNALSKSVSRDIGLSDAKTYLYNSLKKLYPKTYKARLKICEQRYNQKVSEGVTDIVRQLVQNA